MTPPERRAERVDGRVALIGVGRLGEALLDGWLTTGVLQASQVACAEADAGRGEHVAAAHGVEVHRDPAAAAAGAAVVVVAVKPQHVAAALAAIDAEAGPRATVVSVAAGVPLSVLEARLPGGCAVLRAMPNVAARVGQAATTLSAGRGADAERVALARRLLEAVGEVRELDEGLLDAATAVAGSGPAFVILVAEALAEAGVLEGLPRADAEALAARTVAGAGRLLTDAEADAPTLRASVTSPGGTTARGLRALEDGRVRAAVIDAVAAARARAAEIARAAERDLGGR